METLLLLLFAPLIIPVIAKMVLGHKITLQEMGIQMVALCVPIALVVALGYVGQSLDTEVWNGKITNKTRDHGTYEDPYDCFCTRDKDGFESCQTCYETRYTVTWKGYSTVGDFTFQHLDRSSRSVYNEPDPKSYTDCKIGEPASIEYSFKNLVKAVPDSLFNKQMESSVYRVPAYPRVRSFYKINRSINIDSKVPRKDLMELSQLTSEALIDIGSSKQVNVFYILTEIDDPMYRYVVENAWLGGKKNDVVIFIGLDDQEITWTDVMTFGLNIGNEDLHVNLRDELKQINLYNSEKIVNITVKNVVKYYHRPKMSSFSYLEDAIELPNAAIIISVLITIFGSIGLTYYFYVNDIGSRRYRSFNRRRFR